MKGKIVIVTGATSGIGEQTALQLADQGAEVMIISRNEEKCRHTTQEIKEKTGNPKVSYLAADLSSLGEIRKAAATIRTKYSRIDVLVNNVGALFWKREESADGFEKTFALNHLSYFLLTNLLLDLLKNSPSGRIINLSSGAHVGQRLDFNDLQNRKKYRAFTAYGQSKLANIYFTNQLDRRLKGTKITANAVHPGFVATNFAKGGNLVVQLLMPLTKLFALSSEEGAETPVFLAVSPEVEGISGKYFYQKKAISSSPTSYDQKTAEMLWEISTEMTGLPD